MLRGATSASPTVKACRTLLSPISVAALVTLRFMRHLPLAISVAAVIAGTPAEAGAAYRSCKPVINPYAGSRYEGADLTRIRASGLSCVTARRVARGAHRRALEITPSESGIRRFTWRGWKVTGDLRGDVDRYRATRGSDRVRWRF